MGDIPIGLCSRDPRPRDVFWVQGALFAGLDEIFVWVDLPERRFGVPSQETAQLSQRLLRRGRGRNIPGDHIRSGLDQADRLITSASGFHTADPDIS